MKRVFSILLSVVLLLSSNQITYGAQVNKNSDKSGNIFELLNSHEQDEPDLLFENLKLIEECEEVDVTSINEFSKSKSLAADDTSTTLNFDDIRIYINGQPINSTLHIEENLDEFSETDIIESEDSKLNSGFSVDEISTPDESTEFQVMAAATAPDMKVTSISADSSYTNSSGNFVVGSEAGIKFTIQNVGTATATGVKLYIIFAGTSIGYFNIGSFPAGASLTDTLVIGGINAGTHSVEFYIPTVTGETNTSNNSLSKSFTWVNTSGAPDLTSEIISPTDADLLGRVPRAFRFKISNIGNQAAPAGWTLAIVANNDSTRVTIPNTINAGASATYEMELSTSENACGAFTVRLAPNPTWISPYMTESNFNNNESSRNYNIIGNYAAYQNPFKHKSTVSVHIAPSVLTTFSNISQSTWTSWTTGSNGWNSHNPYFKFSAPTFTASHNNADVRVVAGNIPDPNTDGMTILTSGGWADMTIHSGTMNNGRTVQSCYIHEMGHIVGLDHPNDQYGRWYFNVDSIMFTDGSPNEKYYITNTDIFVLKNTIFEN